MCGGRVGEVLSGVGANPREIINDPIGGLTPDYISDPLADLDDQIRGEEQQEAAEEAAQAQEDAAQAGVDLQERIYEEGTERLDPFYQAGLGTLDEYFNLISPEGSEAFRQKYLQGDEYQNRRANTLAELEQSAVFGGSAGTGGALRRVGERLDQQAFDLSNQALAQELSRLGSGVDIGTSAAGALTSAGQNFANQASGLYGQMGQAQAAGLLAGADRGLLPYLQLAGTGAQIYGATV